jgi:hypothetical protein
VANGAEHIDPSRWNPRPAKRIESLCRQIHPPGVVIQRDIQMVCDGFEQAYLINDTSVLAQQCQQVLEGVIGFPLRQADALCMVFISFSRQRATRGRARATYSLQTCSDQSV